MSENAIRIVLVVTRSTRLSVEAEGRDGLLTEEKRSTVKVCRRGVSAVKTVGGEAGIW